MIFYEAIFCCYLKQMSIRAEKNRENLLEKYNKCSILFVRASLL